MASKLANWPDSDWDQFKKELAKGKVKIKDLSLKERKEWKKYFTEEKLKTAEIVIVHRKVAKCAKDYLFQLSVERPESCKNPILAYCYSNSITIRTASSGILHLIIKVVYTFFRLPF